jgi:hypothetical protein
MLCRSDPRGLDAFHTFSVPNTGLFRVDDEGRVTA